MEALCRRLGGFCLVILLGTVTLPVLAQPANDTCATAENLGACPTTSIVIDTTDATPPAGTPDPDLPIGSPSCQWASQPDAPHNTVWYRIEANAEDIFISTCATEQIGTGFSDSVIALYEGDCGSLVEIACNEDICSTGAGGLWLSEICFSGLTIGNSYTIMAGNTGSWAGSIPGELQIDIACPCPPPPVNDNCADALPASDGVTAISNFLATTDGLTHGQQCPVLPESDVWHRYTASFTGEAVFSLCQGTAFDAVMAIYNDNGNCPPTTQDLLVCADDECEAGGPPQATVSVVEGQDYLIRIGGFNASAGVGELAIGPVGCGNGIIELGELCDPPGPDCDANCQFPTDSICMQNNVQPSVAGNLAFTSDIDSGQVAAESFRANETSSVTDICWWGYYLDLPGPNDDCSSTVIADDFTITYYDTQNGVPGTVLAQFSVSPQKVVSDGFQVGLYPRRVFEYTVSHDPVPVNASECYWVEISNNIPGNCTWLWQTAPGSGDGALALDGDLNGFDADELVENDLTLALNIDWSPCVTACCLPTGCMEVSLFGDCSDIGGEGRFGTDCSGFADCGLDACCMPDGSCAEMFESDCNAAGGSFNFGTDCAEIICNLFDDCSWDNGLVEGGLPSPASQFAPLDFFAQAADNMTFLGTGPSCDIEEIVFNVTHFNVGDCFDMCICPNGEFFQAGAAADVCETGDPDDCVPITRGLCSDGSFCWTENTDGNECGGLTAADCTPHPCTNTPDDYRAVWVTIYEDAGGTPGGFPEHAEVPCVDDTDCEPLNGGLGSETCQNGVCADDGGAPFLAPTGGHVGAKSIAVVPAENISWEMDPNDATNFIVTLDMSSSDLDIDQNELRWVAIAPEVPAGPTFYQVALHDSANFDGTAAEQVFEPLGLFPFFQMDPSRDLTFRISGVEGGGTEGIRGDFNYDFVFNGLVDGLGILNFFFIPGSPGTPCDDAADADGNGVLNGLVDGLAILNVAFIPGTPPLPAPFPDCGLLPEFIGCAGAQACP